MGAFGIVLALSAISPRLAGVGQTSGRETPMNTSATIAYRERTGSARNAVPASTLFSSGRLESELAPRERDDEVKRAFYRLPLDMRSVLLLRILDRLPFETIAVILELAPASVRKRYSTAVELLRNSPVCEGAKL